MLLVLGCCFLALLRTTSVLIHVCALFCSLPCTFPAYPSFLVQACSLPLLALPRSTCGRNRRSPPAENKNALLLLMRMLLMSLVPLVELLPMAGFLQVLLRLVVAAASVVVALVALVVLQEDGECQVRRRAA